MRFDCCDSCDCCGGPFILQTPATLGFQAFSGLERDPLYLCNSDISLNETHHRRSIIIYLNTHDIVCM